MNKEGYFHPETDNYKFWTEQEETRLKELVLTGKNSFKGIGVIMKRSGQSCQDHSRLMGLNNTFKPRKYTFREGFWEIPNKINSYYAGFSAADASLMCAESGYCTYRLEIGEIDKEFMEKFKQNISFDGPIKVNKRIKKIKSHGEFRDVSTISFCICSKKWANDLKNNFNIVPCKTKILSLPNLPNSLIWCWLAGYICGDGCIYISKNGKKFFINFVSASEIIINSIADLIRTHFKDNCQRFYNQPGKQFCNPKKLKHANAYFLAITGTRAAVLFDYLSQIEGLPRLERKWLQPKVLEYVAKIKAEYPHFFKTFEYNNELNQQLQNLENSSSQSSIPV